MVERKELEEKVLAYRILEARLNSLLKQRDMLISRIIEIQNTLQSIEEIEKSGEDVLFPIGSEAYTFGKVAKKGKIIVEIGANIAQEKTVEEGKKILNKRKLETESALNAVQKSIIEISLSMEKLGPEIEELVKKLEEQEAG